MSTATLPPTAGDYDDWDSDAEFEAIVSGFDEPATTHRPSRAAQRREARTQIERGLGIVRHRTGEREV